MVTTRSSASTSKRTRSDDESQDENATPKRARTSVHESSSKDSSENMDPFFMFSKKDMSEDEEEISRLDPPKSYAESIRRDKRLRQLDKKNNPGSRRSLVRRTGQNPFGISTSTQQERETKSLENYEREERSAATEPETPKPPRGLFGSLRSLGSATIGRAHSLFGNFTPRSGTNTPDTQTISNPRVPSTEPRGMRKSKPVWEIEYPQLPKTPQVVDQEESASEKKRRAFEAKYGETNRDYDHLHTESIDGDPDNLPYPLKKKPLPEPETASDDLSPALARFRQERKRKRIEKYGYVPDRPLPKIAPLFGPDSHATRRTVNPRLKEFSETGVHPADREAAERGRKTRALAAALPSDSKSKATSVQAPTRTFQPFVEDESDDINNSDDPSTPAAKKQKTSHQMPQTPRSAMKVPGSIGRGRRSVMFNPNPVASIKRMTPPTNASPAGTYNPNSIFKTFADAERDRQLGLVENTSSPSSDISSDPSPNTRANTFFNSQVHPGDALTNAINTANPEKIDYVWRDPANENWRPSLANPRPGTFRFVPEEDEDEEMELLAQIEREESVKVPTQTSVASEPEDPQPPSTPRMSHAELPKLNASTQNPTTPASAAASASALEAANLERRRAEAAKTRPKTSSRLAEVTSARSRSPSPPDLDAENSEGASPTESAAKTPSPILEQGTWTWSDETNEYIASNPRHPDFAFNRWGELTPSSCLRSSNGQYDDNLVGPDGFTEMSRQAHYRKKYDDEWAKEAFPFDKPLTYEEAGVGTKHIHDLIKKNDALYPELVDKADKRFAEEWDAHQKAIEDAAKLGKRLVAIYPDRDGMEMLDAE